MSRYRLFQLVSVAILVAGLVAAVVLFNTLLRRQRQEIQRAADTETRHIGSQFQAGIATAIEPLRQLGTWWLTQGQPFDVQDWQSDGRLFLTSSPGLQRAGWVDPRGIQRWSAAPNSAPVRMNRRPEERIQRLVALAQGGETPAMSPVFDLPDGRAGIDICVPIMKSGRNVGYLLGTYDASALVSSLAQTEVRPDTPVVISMNGRQLYVAPGADALWREQRAGAELNVMGQKWTIAGFVPLGPFREFRGLILSVVSVIGALLYSFAMLLMLAHRRSAQFQRSNQALETEMRRRERSEAEAHELNHELTRRVADFQTLLDVIPIGIAVAEDAECSVVRPNRALAEFLGVPQAMNISLTGGDAGNHAYRLLREGRPIGPEESPLRLAVALRKPIKAQEYRVERPDGSVVDALGFAAPVFEENGRVRGALAAYVDITEHKAEEQIVRELEQRLRRAERLQCLGVMAAGVAHDFNNLLTGMIGQASLAADILPPGDEAQSHIAECLEAGLRAAELVKKVTAFTGLSHHELRPVDLGEAVLENQPLLLSLAGSKAELRCQIAGPLPKALADPDEARHALVNLVLNAVEAAEPGRNHIHIRVEACELRGGDADIKGDTLDPGLYVQIEVGDDGVGMPPDIAERAFDPFFTTKFLGRGLGLSEVLGIMRSHRGGVSIESSPDSGTSVRLYFPAEPPIQA